MAVWIVLWWIKTEPHNSLTSFYTSQKDILSGSEGPLFRTSCLCSVINTYSTPVCPHTHTHTHTHTTFKHPQIFSNCLTPCTQLSPLNTHIFYAFQQPQTTTLFSDDQEQDATRSQYQTVIKSSKCTNADLRLRTPDDGQKGCPNM